MNCGEISRLEWEGNHTFRALRVSWLRASLVIVARLVAARSGPRTCPLAFSVLLFSTALRLSPRSCILLGNRVRCGRSVGRNPREGGLKL